MDKRTYLKNIGALGLFPLTDQLHNEEADSKLIYTADYNESDFWKLVRRLHFLKYFERFQNLLIVLLRTLLLQEMQPNL